MTTAVEICNLGISMFGLGSLISALDENSTEAQHCNLHYETARDQTLEDFDWSFASVEQALALTGTAPARWTYSYARPSNCIVEREIVNNFSDIPIEYELASTGSTRLIYTDVEDAYLRFTYQVTDPNLFTTGFKNALACRIAMAIAMPLTKNREIMADAANMYGAFLRAAEVTDANKGHKKIDRDAEWTRART